MRDIRKVRMAVIAASVALAAAACGGGTTPQSSGNSNGPQTLTWWHNGALDPLKTLWQQTADAYHAAHPNVKIVVDPIQNEQFTTKIPLALQSTSPPDLYQQWGGGQEATQLKSGKLADLTDSVSGWLNPFGSAVQGWQVNGRQYGVPYDLHVVGFWYRKDLFAQAGISGTPKTLADLESDVAKLKSRGHLADRAGRQGPLARRVLLGLLRGPRMLGEHDEAGGQVARPR